MSQRNNSYYRPTDLVTLSIVWFKHTYIYCFVAAISWIKTDTQINNQSKKIHTVEQNITSVTDRFKAR